MTDRGQELPSLESIAIGATPVIPVCVITGFLGSGKTTLIRDCLARVSMADTAVIVNEFGEVGLDHLLVEQASEDTLLLANGCLCCTWQSDLAATLRSLLARRERGEIPSFRQVFIETSGLVDPGPVLQTLLSDPLRLSPFKTANLVTVVDATGPPRTLEAFDQCERQIALSDRVILSKTDVASAEQHGAMVHWLRSRFGVTGEPRSQISLTSETFFELRGVRPIEPTRVKHNQRVYTWSRELETPLTWEAIGNWFESLLAQHGEAVLRVKGLVEIAGESRPVVLQGVRHTLARPEFLPRWPDDRMRGRLLVIASDPEIRDLSPPARRGPSPRQPSNPDSDHRCARRSTTL